MALEIDQYFRGDEGRGRKGRLVSATLLVAGAYGASWLLTSYSFDRFKKQQELIMPEGAQIELSPLTQEPVVVFEGQDQPKCPGDIEKVEILRDGTKEFRALKVTCKPNNAEPAK